MSDKETFPGGGRLLGVKQQPVWTELDLLGVCVEAADGRRRKEPFSSATSRNGQSISKHQMESGGRGIQSTCLDHLRQEVRVEEMEFESQE